MTIISIVENILKRLEHGITIDDHKKNFNRLIQEINIFIEINSTKNLSIEMSHFIVKVQNLIDTISNVARLNNEDNKNSGSETYLLEVNEPDIFLQEDILRGAIIELSTIQLQFNPNPVSYIKHNENLFNNIRQILNCASWSGSKDEIVAARAISKACFFGLRNGIIEINHGADILSQLIYTFPPKKWFSSGRVIIGSSFLLNSLILLCKSDCREKFIDYTNNVCERLLAKVEIKQEKIFNFYGYEPKGTFLILEQMRFNLLLLEISSTFNDLRFLNAAMKSNDRLYSFFKRLRLSINTTNLNIQKIVAAIYYCLGIKIQEELYIAALHER